MKEDREVSQKPRRHFHPVARLNFINKVKERRECNWVPQGPEMRHREPYHRASGILLSNTVATGRRMDSRDKGGRVN
ncbi:hypothetical protein NPIL_557131 [Nephila pilipes]|uniref:Uncharacterized protein n=1 Tax=Nephila pilipes TaxID=299642 RepID=A0A8X6U0K7_NEPPI|nr:hypothetical protein NPIL_557131 [Nephila pilipes]